MLETLDSSTNNLQASNRSFVDKRGSRKKIKKSHIYWNNEYTIHAAPFALSLQTWSTFNRRLNMMMILCIMTLD